MERSEKIFLILLSVALFAVVAFEVNSRRVSSNAAPATDSTATDQQAPPEIGPAYLTMNTPSFNPGPPIYNVMPSLSAGVSTQNGGGNSSCSSCGS